MMRLAFDRSVRSFDQDGHLHVASSVISASCVNNYTGAEIPNCQELGLDPRKVYALLRDPAELQKASPTFNGKPLLSAHRPQTAEDHDHGLVVGTVANPQWDNPYLLAELVIWDAAAIRSIQDGSQKSLSCGYRYSARMTPGTFNGTPYQGIMADIRGNHVTLCPEPRVPGAFVGDSAPPRKRGFGFIMDSDDMDSDDGKFVADMHEYLKPKLEDDELSGAHKVMENHFGDGIYDYLPAGTPRPGEGPPGKSPTAMDSRARLRQTPADRARFDARFPNATRLVR